MVRLKTASGVKAVAPRTVCHHACVPVAGFDHVAITVADVDATIAWYQRVLGAEPLYLDLWRDGHAPDRAAPDRRLAAERAPRRRAGRAPRRRRPPPAPPTSASASTARSPRSSRSSTPPTSRWSTAPCRGRRRTASPARRSTSAIPTATSSSCSRSTPTRGLIVDFTESDEHAMLRAAAGDVAAVSDTTGSASSRAPAAAPTSSGRRMAAPGFLSVHLPEEYGGGGGGLSELVVVSEAARRAGMPAAARSWCRPGSPPSCLARFGTDAQRARWLPGLCTRREDGVRDHRARRRLQQPPPLDHRDSATATSTASAAPRPTSRASTKRRAMLVVARTGVDEATGSGARSSRCSSSTPTPPGLERTPIPVEIAHPGEAVPRSSSTTSRCPPTASSARRATACARCSSASTRSASSSASICTGIGRYALERASAYAQRARGVGRADRARTRASRIRSHAPRSSSSWRAS